MWNVGPDIIPYNSTATITLSLPTTAIHSVEPPVKVQIQNASSLFITADAGSLSVQVPPQSALTIPVAQGETGVDVIPGVQSVAGFSTVAYVSAIFLSAGETSPYPDGPLATPTSFPTSLLLFDNITLTWPGGPVGYNDTVLYQAPPIYHTAMIVVQNSNLSTSQLEFVVGPAYPLPPPAHRYYSQVFTIPENTTQTYAVPLAAIPGDGRITNGLPTNTNCVLEVALGANTTSGNSVVFWAYADQGVYPPSPPPAYTFP